MNTQISDLIDTHFKSFPGDVSPLQLTEIGKQQWNILKGDVPLPAAVLLKSALENNARWMQNFLRYTQVSLAPHGKTSMSPQLFKQQLADGAWGITVATYQQFYVCWQMGVRHILMANQLVDPASIRGVFAVLQKDPQLHFYCLVDSLAAADLLNKHAQQWQLNKPVDVLLEVGLPSVKGGRTGCRDINEALTVANYISTLPTLQLAGIECFEGLFPNITEVETLLNQVTTVATLCDE